jgi:diguanylate cyclase (GGDEF)-like protein
MGASLVGEPARLSDAMLDLNNPDLLQALDDFALASGHLIVVRLYANGILLDFNRGFEMSVRPAGDPRGRPFADFVSTHQEQAPDIVPGLPGGAPVPYPLRAWGGQALLLHAYPAADGQTLLVGTLTSLDETQHIETLSRLTTHMSNLVRELRRANQHIQEVANHDGLTGLPNRRYFLERLEVGLSHARRHHQALSVLMADLDSFKQVNDRFGHAAGDLVLTAFAALLRDNARASDLAGRLGGEEFAVMLPETSPVQAFEMAERLRAAMASLQPLGPEQSVTVTVSIGIGVLQDDDSVDHLLARADTALYAAKAEGRNRISLELPQQPMSGAPTATASPSLHS